ncbi:MAG: bifunctional phosphopantothenoylcysteine decarboxylase/phosphopantothenate--cysteine ligase CoaBC [Gaiellaceae bacterium]
MARVLQGVTGGIAAYKACELTRFLVRAGHDVMPLLTPGAERFVTAETFRALARSSDPGPYPHLERADLMVVAPATANILARLAHGLADNLVAEAALAHAGPLVVAPAMNVRMWEHPATRANVALLHERGVHVVGPEEGELAEGEWGTGRMAEPEAIFSLCAQLLTSASGSEPQTPGALAGRRVLVSAGGTREPLDSVRFLGNRSSGRMGVALAEEARRRGAQVTLLAANLAVPAPAGVEVIETPSAADLEREALAREADVVIMAAAVADYRPKETLGSKRPKDDQPWRVELEPTTDVLRALGERARNGQVLVGFAAEHGEGGLARAREKLARKAVDLVVYNDVSRDDVGFDSDDNEVVIIAPDGDRPVPRSPKREIAALVLDQVAQLLEERDGQGAA